MAPNGFVHMLDDSEIDSFVPGERVPLSLRKPRAMTYQERLEDEMNEAAKKGDEVIKSVLEKAPTFVTNVAGNELKLVVNNTIPLNKLDNSTKQSELFEAAKVGQLSLAALLIDANASVTFRDPLVCYDFLSHSNFCLVFVSHVYFFRFLLSNISLFMLPLLSLSLRFFFVSICICFSILDWL